jgi:hypothetical protein
MIEGNSMRMGDPEGTNEASQEATDIFQKYYSERAGN